ncbi:MAG: lipopolysaccharide assembly protein LapA domain-containing protein [Firmicutes bacterium]|nr:lipopolysaccharide assembly protein LapA domain-containing protein [Bacillota bacterium]
MPHHDDEIAGSASTVNDAETMRSSNKLEMLKPFWFIIVIALTVLVLLIVFIAQNNQNIVISYLGFHWHTHLGIALLLSAVSGGIIVALLIGWRSVYINRKTAPEDRADRKHSS